MKILCLGNNTQNTDDLARNLAAEQSAQYHGLISEITNKIPEQFADGWYHSSVYDIEYTRLTDLANEFDLVIMLNQTKDQYSHPDAFYRTVSLIKKLRNGQFQDSNLSTDINFFENLVQTNKSFCIFPFIELLTNMRDDGYTTVCCRSSTPIAHVDTIVNWKNDANYTAIRQRMLTGTPVDEHCLSCYQIENKNILSARQRETVEWANRLNLKSLSDLEKIDRPSYYEIRPGNTCNLQCRMCSPRCSHLVGREYYKLKLIDQILPEEKTNFDIVDFTDLKKLYVAGGEPTAMPEFYDFLDKCIDQSQTNFEFLINTNGTKINRRLKTQLKHFSNLQFIISLDGFNDLNHYIRWPSNWNQIIENMHYLRNNGHVIATNTTISIYNVCQLYTLLKFFDDEFPNMLVHGSLCVSDQDLLSAFNFPDAKQALRSLEPITQLRCYKNDDLLKSLIDALILHYQTKPGPDLVKLKLFFDFNDVLDQSRNIFLKDYIPELDQTRGLVQ